MMVLAFGCAGMFALASAAYVSAGWNLFEFHAATKDDAGFLVYACPVLAITCALMGTPKYLALRRLRIHGVEVTGAVLELGIMYRGHRDVHYSYVFQGRTFTDKNSFDLTRATRLAQGQAVTVVLDPGKPTRHFVLLD